MQRFTVNRAKLKELVLYICGKCDPAKLGNVKLHKILYYADMLHYVTTGHPITGVSYIKQQYGPCANHLSSVLAELRSEGALDIEEVDYYGFRKKQYTPLRPADERLFQRDGELALVDSVIREFGELTAKQISEISHQIPWQRARMGEELPYRSAFSLMPAEVTEEDIEWGRQERVRIEAKR